MMKKWVMIFSAAALLVLPATAMAHQGDGRKDAAKRCKAEASKNGNGHRCKSERARKKHALRRAAVQSCKGELEDDVQAFVAKYGRPAGPTGSATGVPQGSEGESPAGSEGESPQKGAEGERPGKVARAFKKCVKQKVKAAKKEMKHAARTCRSERRDDPDAFRAKYGTNANRHNAFGKCVSAHAREGDDGADPEDDTQENLPEIV